MDTKTCSTCNQALPVEQFYLRNGVPNDSRCKACVCAAHKVERAGRPKRYITHKICTMCQQDLPRTEEFFSPIRRHGKLTGYQGRCKPCAVKYVAEWREQNPELLRAHRIAALADMKARRKADPELFSARDRQTDLRRHYGLTVEQYDARLAKQNGVCGICEQPCNSGRRLAVDHDHKCCPGKQSCGKCVRGLLCGRCNHALERFDEVLEFASRVTRYLGEFTMAGPKVTGAGKDIYGYDALDSGMAGDAIDEALSNLGQLNRADVNSVQDKRAKADLGYPAKRGN